MNTNKGGNKKRAGRRTATPLRHRRTHARLRWWALVSAAAVAAVILLAVVALRGREDNGAGSGGSVIGSPATDFSLPTVGGGSFSLAEYKGQKNVLLFFNEGYGCDPCFTQIRELQAVKAQLDATDTVMLSVMINPLDVLAREAARFGIDTRAFPMATDPRGAVGKQYGAWGKGMHADNFGHGFVLVDKQGVVRWQVEEPSMYVPPKVITDKLQEISAS